VGLVGDVEMAGFGPQPELGTQDRLRQEASVLRRHDGVLLAVDDQRRCSDLAEPVEVLCVAAAATWWPYALGSGGKRTRCAMSSAIRSACRRRVVSAYV
jgi:hypothetical protein